MFETCNLASWLAKKDLRFAPKNFVSNRWKTAPRDVKKRKKIIIINTSGRSLIFDL